MRGSNFWMLCLQQKCDPGGRRIACPRRPFASALLNLSATVFMGALSIPVQWHASLSFMWFRNLILAALFQVGLKAEGALSSPDLLWISIFSVYSFIASIGGTTVALPGVFWQFGCSIRTQSSEVHLLNLSTLAAHTLVHALVAVSWAGCLLDTRS